MTHVTDINNGTQQTDLNALMGHNSTTAIRYYYVPVKKNKTLWGFQLLQSTYNNAANYSDEDHFVEADNESMELDVVTVTGESSISIEAVHAPDESSDVLPSTS